MQFHFTPERYLSLMRDAIPDYDEFEDEVATAMSSSRLWPSITSRALPKADLFRRIGAAMVPNGRFVMGDVVVPRDPDEAVTPISDEHDHPDRPAALMAWLRDAGFAPEVIWSRRDLAVFTADLRG